MIIGLTSFQDKILKQIKKIPRGYVSTYKMVARACGKPKAVRSVGRACAQNSYLISIPCHRVIRSSGEIGNYQKGRAAKVKILKSEGIKIKSGRFIAEPNQIYHFKIK